MRYFYFVCDFVYVYTKVLLTFWLISKISIPKSNGLAGKAVPVIAAVPIAVLNVYNSSISASLFSNNMMLIVICLIWLLGRVLFKEYQGNSFLLSFIFWDILALLDFFIQSLSYGIMEMRDKSSDILLRVSYDRGFYMLVMTLTAIVMCRYIKKPLEAGTLKFIYSGIRGIMLWILLGGSVIYFQKIYKLIVSAQYIRSWGVFIMMSFFTMLLAFVYILKQKECEKNRIRQLKIEMLESNYQQLLDQYQDKSTFLHDTKNHMNVIRELAEEGEVQKIIEYIEQNYYIFHNKDKMVWTDHQMLNLILNMKCQEAAEEQISMAIDCKDVESLNISPEDLCSLFTNLLDNAIEANKRREEGEERWISLSCKRHGSMLVIHAENPVSQIADTKNGALKSIKKDEKWHGFGLLIMQKIVNKYDGYMEYEVKDGRFIMIQYLVGFTNEGR